MHTAEREPTDNIVLQVGFYALLAFLFCLISRVLDVAGQAFRIPLILGLLFAASAALTLRIQAFLQYPAGKALVGFFLWMLVSFPFSVWRGGSVETITGTMRAMFLMAGIVALATNIDRTYKVMHTLGYAVVTAGILSYFLGGQVTGRLVLGSQGTLADPNTMAMTLLVGVPFIILRGANTPNFFAKTCIYVLAVLVLLAVARTGSRSGMLAIAAMCLILFLRAGMKGKAILALGLCAAAIVAPFFISDFVRARYLTWDSAEEVEDESLVAAASSTKARSYLFWRSIDLTLANPIVGVGPGMFAVAEDEASREESGVRGAWHTTHNTFTQISSELGLPALLFFGFALGCTWLVPYRVMKAIPKDATGEKLKARKAALAFELSLTAFTVNAMFLSLAYAGVPFTLVGMGIVFQTAANRLIATAPAPKLVHRPVVIPGMAPGRFQWSRNRPF